MVDKIISPRRDEVFSNDGKGTTRMMEYLEQNTEQTNNSTESTEADPATVNLSNAQVSQINKKIAEIVSENLISQNALVSKLNKRIEQLESALLSSNNSKTNKKVTALENDFIAPFYKTKYDKLTIKNATISELLKLPQTNNAASPTVQFGDGDTGFYEESDDVLMASVNGSKRFSFRLTDFRSETTNGAAILFENPSATNPSLIPNITDNNTGIGWAAPDELTIIAGGTEGVRLTTTRVILTASTEIQLNTPTVSGPSGSWSTSGFNVSSSDAYHVGGTQVVSSRGAAVGNATGGAVIDVEARAAINALLSRVKTHGLIA